MADSHEVRLREWLADVGLTPFEGEFDEHTVVLKANHGGIIGYTEFLAIFSFRDDGSLQTVGIWE